MSNQMSSTMMMSRTGGLPGMIQGDKENTGNKVPSSKTQQMMEAQKSVIMNQTLQSDLYQESSLF